MTKRLKPPESVKRVDDCKLRAQDDVCCNAVNYLRPHICNGYCVVKVDQWLREEHPHLNDEEIRMHVIRITEHPAR